MMKKNLELFFSSPMEYEELTLEIQLDRERIIEINQDKGVNHLEAELFGSDQAHGFVAKVPLDELIAILIEARETLKNK
ncbi:hypothetical protein COO59_13695 [Mixta theicola]|uniref:Uncharacterized protein n=1 Tax=Mixta theicola TaxID=1458355 RepID=A0A2K1Q7G2_9GAMM|nr:hypothetical protein [Mixta theicola]PNS10983.1 hypothetical protein COO59_13695 [Mixta theicola]GLR08324.1 hypothetical protein GCM10007905_10430 [Mixta theicola]